MKPTVEPTMFLQFAGDTLTYVIYQNLFIDKICITELGYSTETCSAYSKISEIPEDDPKYESVRQMASQIQISSSKFILWNSLVENSIPLFLILFLGVWSDHRKRRKPPLLLSLTGKLLRSIGLFLSAWYMDLSTIWLLVLAALPHSLGGANPVFQMSSFSYISDISTPRDRTLRIGIAEAFWQLGIPVGLLLGSFLFKNGGYLSVFGTAVVFHSLALFYTFLFVGEVPKPRNQPQFARSKHGWYGTWENSFDGRNSCSNNNGFLEVPGKRIRYYSDQTCENPQDFEIGEAISDRKSDNNTKSSSCQNYDDESRNLLVPTPDKIKQKAFNSNKGLQQRKTAVPESAQSNFTEVLHYTIGVFKTMMQKRSYHVRKCLWAMAFTIFVGGIVLSGEYNFRYLFTKNKFGWNETQFSNWVVYESIMHVAGLFIVMPILSKLFKWKDPFIGAFAVMHRICSKSLYAISKSSSWLYIGATVEIPGLLPAMAARSLVSKCVNKDERGKVFAFMGFIEALVPLIGVPLYSLVYTNTLDVFPSAIYFMSVGMHLAVFIVFIALFAMMKMNILQLNVANFISFNYEQNGEYTEPNTYRRISLA